MGMTVQQRAKLFQEPTVIGVGLLSHWPRYEPMHLGNLSLRIDSQDNRESVEVEADGSSSPEADEALAEQARRDAEEELWETLVRDFRPPKAFVRSSQWMVHSVGRTSGVHMCKHGFAWLAAVVGGKAWFLAPPERPRPDNPECQASPQAAPGATLVPPHGVTHACMQKEGEVVVAPTAWWHATCNLGVTVAIGGQDECDLVRDCFAFVDMDPVPDPTYTAKPMWRYCADPTLHESCHGDAGEEHARRAHPRLLQPLWRLGHEVDFEVVENAAASSAAPPGGVEPTSHANSKTRDTS